MRQIVLDTETTGINPADGHRIIEIGCVELENRRLTGRRFHEYINPQRKVDEDAVRVHGLDNHFLDDKPLFAEIVEPFLDFVRGAELVIHNAPFDMGFLNHELNLWQADYGKLERECGVLDTLTLARQHHPGQKNNLDALCKRYGIDNSARDLHGALLDAEILAEVYLAMTGGQVSLLADEKRGSTADTRIRRIVSERPSLPVIKADATELAAHRGRLAAIAKASGGDCLWLQRYPPENNE